MLRGDSPFDEARKYMRPTAAVAREHDATLGPHDHDGARVCPASLSRNHHQRQCAGATLQDVGNRETKQGHC